MTLHLPGYALWPQSALAAQPTAVALGIFDGVHLGHQALLTSLCQQARKDGLVSVVLTFDPHPAKVLRPAYAPLLLEPIAARVAHLNRMGVDAVIAHPFDVVTAGIAAESFVREVLHGMLHAKHIFVGADFVFGHKQGGDTTLLGNMGRELGFEVHPLQQVRVAGMVASSTKVREFVRRGALSGAEDLLGRPYALYCRRKHMPKDTGAWKPYEPEGEQMPAPGLYAAWAADDGHETAALVYVAHLEEEEDRNVEIYAHPLRGDALLPKQTRCFKLKARLHAMPANTTQAFRAPSSADINAAAAVLATQS